MAETMAFMLSECVNALNGLLSFLQTYKFGIYSSISWLCQRPKRASFISTQANLVETYLPECVNALNGLLSFLRYPLRTRINTGFAGSFLQVFVWKFWNQAFFCSFFGMFTICSYFKSIFHPPSYKHYTLAFSKMKVKFLISISTLYLQALSSISN